MNNLVSDHQKETNRKRKRENADLNYHNYYVKISKSFDIYLIISVLKFRLKHNKRHGKTWFPTVIHPEVPEGERQQPLHNYILPAVHGLKLLNYK